MLFITFWSRNSRIFYEKVKFWAGKTTKIIKILDLLKMLTSAIFFVEFNFLIKKITQNVLPPKTPIKTKYKCKKREKVDFDNSM